MSEGWTERPSVRYYDREGLPITLEGWTELHADDEYRRIAETRIGQADVSTVWLGIDHGYGYTCPLAPRHIFETMIFGGDHDGYCERYATEKDARSGHEIAVNVVRYNLPM